MSRVKLLHSQVKKMLKTLSAFIKEINIVELNMTLRVGWHADIITANEIKFF